jgi:hypothetical protein
MITNWALKARSALRNAIPHNTAKVTRSMPRGGSMGKTHNSPSRNPKMYIATPSGRVRYSGIPIEPPTSRPRDLFMMA